MNNIIILKLVSIIGSLCVASSNIDLDEKKNIDIVEYMKEDNIVYNYTIKSISGQNIDLKKFKNKKILFVNIASKCGFTKQLKSLQTLYEKYKNDLVIIASPSNDFMNQEPLEGEQILNFCQVNYGVTFLVTEKIHVKGKQIHPLYDFLTNKELNGWNNDKTSWNFNKFLINEKGVLTHHFGSMVSPMSKKIINNISSSITS